MNERKELKELLREPIAKAIKREQTAFDCLSMPFNNSLVLFGAGGLGQRTLTGLRKVGIEPLAFADNNSSLWGKKIGDLQVLSPQEAAVKFGDKAVFVVTVWRAGGGHRFEKSRRQLNELGCSKVATFAALYWKYADIFLPYYAIGLPHDLLRQAEQIENAYSLWEDAASRYEYIAQLRFRLNLDFDGLPSPVPHSAYFADDLFDISENEIFVDGGAYDGDTLNDFFRMKKLFRGKYFAFEPDPINIKAMQNRISAMPESLRERIMPMPIGLGSHKGRVHFSATGLPSSGISSDGTYEVEIAALDEVLTDAPTFIKMDIEGCEPGALIGARRYIENNHPILAICVYHKPDHLWQIPLLINSFSDQYRFFLRPHNEEGWDLVCYAVPAERLKWKSKNN